MSEGTQSVCEMQNSVVGVDKCTPELTTTFIMEIGLSTFFTVLEDAKVRVSAGRAVSQVHSLLKPLSQVCKGPPSLSNFK